MTDATINDAVPKQLAEFPDLGEELQQIALQRLTEAGEIQAAMERIADLEAALRESITTHEQSIYALKGREHCGFLFGAIERARAALAGEAAPRLTDRQIDNVTRRQCGSDLDLVLAYRQFARAIEAKVMGTP